jgi:phosphoribosylglycinamide formyltransferase-1
MKKRIVILVSGNGTNAQAIIDECLAGNINADVIAIVSNRPTAYALERAKKHGIQALCIDHKAFNERNKFDEALLLLLQSLKPDLIVLAGFMRILSSDLVEQFAGKMLNIHPSLLPKYPGLHTHQRALDNGDQLHGASVHFVSAELDGGPVVLQSVLKIENSDTADMLASRIAKTEWQIYPQAVSWFCDERLQWQADKVSLDNKTLPKSGIKYEKAKL